LGPVDILADSGVLPGVLSVGPLHTTDETLDAWKAKVTGGNKALIWPQVHVFTRQSAAALAKAGVHAGTRMVIAQSRRHLVEVGDCLAGYFLDDRVCLTIMLAAAMELRAAKTKPAHDVYLVATCQEEIAGGSAAHAARTLPGATTLAIDVGPVAQEYGTELSDAPIVVYCDARGVYTQAVCDRLLAIGRKMKLEPQTAHWESYGSDASCSKQVGNTPRTGLLCIPTENTHGFEIIPKGAILPCAKLLAEYLRAPEVAR
ncbi:MAG TPA: peptidase M42, partial [Planctomycetota bacterium]|nr:peptidase M42 [Planctomycetota bacterium]